MVTVIPNPNNNFCICRRWIWIRQTIGSCWWSDEQKLKFILAARITFLLQIFRFLTILSISFLDDPKISDAYKSYITYCVIIHHNLKHQKHSQTLFSIFVLHILLIYLKESHVQPLSLSSFVQLHKLSKNRCHHNPLEITIGIAVKTRA